MSKKEFESSPSHEKASHLANIAGGLMAPSTVPKSMRHLILSKEGHKAAGEAYLQAAKDNPRDSDYHRGQAEREANRAGDAWDEAKHPRDENGKFQ